ncbi:MAG TPA: hypothetical protein DCF68_20740, partial [Cyanothece sp. UBA12306]|nr:hypothetical protein [Cyanothece sp. UBA12306]
PETGNLSYTPATGANGTANITVILSDDGGTVNGGVDTSTEQTFNIAVITDQPPTTSGIDDVVGNEDQNPTIISLFDAFDDAETEDNELDYSIIDNTNADLFSSLEIDDNSGELTLTY